MKMSEEMKDLTLDELNAIAGGADAKKEDEHPAYTHFVEYKVVAGDNLHSIARLFGIKNWRDIYNANRNKIKNPDLIENGWILRIPQP